MYYHLQMIKHGDVSFNLRREANDNFFGSLVLLTRRFFNPEIPDEELWLPAALAVMSLADDPLNGVAYRSAKIDWVGVYAPDWEMSG